MNSYHNKLYDNRKMVNKWLKYTKDCKIPKNIVPKCPVCGKNTEMNNKTISFNKETNRIIEDLKEN